MLMYVQCSMVYTLAFCMQVRPPADDPRRKQTFTVQGYRTEGSSSTKSYAEYHGYIRCGHEPNWIRKRFLKAAEEAARKADDMMSAQGKVKTGACGHRKASVCTWACVLMSTMLRRAHHTQLGFWVHA